MLKDAILEAKHPGVIDGLFHCPEPRRKRSSFLIIRALPKEGQLGPMNSLVECWSIRAKSFRKQWNCLSGVWRTFLSIFLAARISSGAVLFSSIGFSGANKFFVLSLCDGFKELEDPSPLVAADLSALPATFSATFSDAFFFGSRAFSLVFYSTT